MKRALERTRDQLLAELREEGYWEGCLSSSALATAVAVFALKQAGNTDLARKGAAWIEQHRNADGGWGDSPESPSNFTATLLCRCALDEQIGAPAEVVRSILEFYGDDRTFSAPILTMCMLAGKLGEDWTLIPQLPFELAAVPHRFYRFLRLPVVSYAIPALISIGLVRHAHGPSKFAPWRGRMIPKVLDILQGIQPQSGGFLEAAPLTGFVVMSLIGAGVADHPVVQAGVRFLEETVREDGSWAIDVDLSSWVTSLAVSALEGDLSDEQQERIRNHLESTQWKTEHPFTHAAPGGWGWTHRTGGVPDADDTAAALIALHQLGAEPAVAERGIIWLLDLQNRDGGMPTFCKGWGKLPFDRSCPDLTAHMIRAFCRWRGSMAGQTARRMDRAMVRALRYLQREQQPDGSWIPLWFGSQHHPAQENPIYGTVRVLEALQEVQFSQRRGVAASAEKGLCDLCVFATLREKTRLNSGRRVEQMVERGLAWLMEARNADGSWGHSIEETALAVGVTGLGVEQLESMTQQGRDFPPAPIGLYFASLWYSEKLYSLVFTLCALKRCKKMHEDFDE